MPDSAGRVPSCGVAGCERNADFYVMVEGVQGCLDTFAVVVCEPHVRSLDLVPERVIDRD